MVRGNGIKRSETIETGFPCLRYGEIYTSFDVILDKPRSFVPKELFDRSVKIKKGDLVFTLTGENTEEIAKALAYLGDYEIAAGGDLAVWTGHGCDSKYLAYLMYSPQLISQKAATGNGNIVVHTSIKKIQQLEIPLPSLSVQREIVARLERELAAVEKMKKGFEALAETAKAEFKAELKEVFEEISRGGAGTRRLGDVCEFMTSGSRGWAKYYSDSGELFITIKNVKDCAIDVRYVQHVKPPKGAEAERTRVKEGDLLISITADLGRTGVVTKAIEAAGAYINQHLICIRLKKDVMLPMFAAYYIESDGGKKQILNRNKEAVKAGLNFASVSSVLLPFLPLPVQREVVARLDAAKARAEKLEAKAREGVAVCETMRKAILKEAFE